MAVAPSLRSRATSEALLSGALEEFAALGFRRASMEAVARRAGVSRATLYIHHGSKAELFRALVAQLHDDQIDAMERAAAEPGDIEGRLVALLHARFGRWVALTAGSPHAAELYPQHDRLCGDIARAAQERSERVVAAVLRAAVRDGEIDLKRLGLSAPKAAEVLFACAHGAKGEDPSTAEPVPFRRLLERVVRVLVGGLSP